VTTRQPFTNPASYAERAQLLAQDRLHAVAKPAQSGSREAVLYPRLPADSPWAQPQPGVEAPLGIDINALTKETKS